jgi:hypothetical protein
MHRVLGGRSKESKHFISLHRTAGTQGMMKQQVAEKQDAMQRVFLKTLERWEAGRARSNVLNGRLSYLAICVPKQTIAGYSGS